MLDMYWNANNQCFEATIKGKTLTVWPELTGYADGRAAVKFNYDHVDYAWSYVDGVTRTTVAGVTRRTYDDYPSAPRCLIPGLNYRERDMLSDVLVAGINKGRSKYMCLAGGAYCAGGRMSEPRGAPCCTWGAPELNAGAGVYVCPFFVVKSRKTKRGAIYEV